MAQCQARSLLINFTKQCRKLAYMNRACTLSSEIPRRRSESRSCVTVATRTRGWRRDRWHTSGKLQSGCVFGFMGLSLFVDEEEEKEPEDPLIILLKYAKLYEMRQDLPLASTYYHQALDMLSDREVEEVWTSDQVLEGRVYVYAHLANVYFAMFKLDEAEKLYKETIKGLLQQRKEKDDNAILEISLKLSKIFTLQGKYDDAKDGYLFCINLLENKLKGVDRNGIKERDPEDESGDLNTLALLGMSTTSYGRFLIIRQNYNEADDVLKEALTIAKVVFGEEDNQVAVLYNDLATVASHRNDQMLAKERAQTAIEVGEKIGSDDVPMFYCNLCYICVEMQKWEQARKAGKAALKAAVHAGDTSVEAKAQDCLKELKLRRRQSKTA